MQGCFICPPGLEQLSTSAIEAGVGFMQSVLPANLPAARTMGERADSLDRGDRKPASPATRFSNLVYGSVLSLIASPL
jgi:hypothetical protein